MLSLAFLCSFSCSSNKSINNRHNTRIGNSSGTIPFVKDSFNLNEEALFRLKNQVDYVKNSVKKCYILLYPWSSINETKKNPNIGLLRSKAIIDFYETNYSIQRSNFVIMDVNHFDDADWALNPDRDDPFVTFDARFCNPNKEE